MEQLQEYETQLADVEALLEASPKDESLLSLKSDLVELLNITRESLPAGEALEPAVTENVAESESAQETTVAETSTSWSDPTSTSVPASSDPVKRSPAEAAAAEEPPKKKSKKLKDFEVPEHLIPLDTDVSCNGIIMCW
jgi:hypothetical protein